MSEHEISHQTITYRSSIKHFDVDAFQNEFSEVHWEIIKKFN